MAKTITIISLIQSLSKAEKRYFRLHTSLQKGTKDYMCLFESLNEGMETANAKKAFRRKRPKANYEATLKHLYKVLMDSLLRLRMDQNKNTSLVTALLKANILFEKSLYEEGFSQLKKIQADAEEYEHYIVHLWAARMELHHLSNLNFHAIPESDLIKKQMQIQKITRYSMNINQHTSLYELLKHRLVYKGHVRTTEQKKELSDLVVSELNIVSNPLADTVESYKTHLLFQAHYFIAINEYKSALKAFYELNDLLEEHQYLWEDSPADYLAAIEGILDSLRTINHYDDMTYFIKKIQGLPEISLHFQIMVQRVIYIYSVAGLINRGEFEKAIILKTDFEESLFKKIQVLDAEKQAEVYLYTALIYFGNNDMNSAHRYLNKVLLESRQYYNLPVYQTFRLIHLLVHYELRNHDIILHEIRSVKRKLKSSKSYKLEKIIFKFLQTSTHYNSEEERVTLWMKFKTMFEKISSDKYEIQVLKIFDFAAWIEAKLCRKPFAEVLKKGSKMETSE